LGFVFYAPSPRAVQPDSAACLFACLPPFVTSVGLFVDADPAYVREVIHRLPIDLLQFHGDESPEYCGSFGRPWIKAVRMRRGTDLGRLRARYGAAAGILLDTYDPSAAGGTGRRFDWGLIPRETAGKIVLAGGLDATNVAEAIRRVRPYGVDVSGGVESEKGIKSRRKMAAFMKGVTDGDESR
jgi:phosphoribosylanthranilate isomerase